MKTLIVLAILGWLIVMVLKAAKKKADSGAIRAKDTEGDATDSASNIRDARFFSKSVLTEIEQTLFHRLKEACSEQTVMAQVAMSALVGIRKSPEWKAHFNQISRKYVDFVLCNPDFSVFAVVELDDKTHEQYDRWKSDDVKNVAFKSAGIRLIRFKAKDLPSVEQIKAVIGTVQEEISGQKGKAFFVD